MKYKVGDKVKIKTWKQMEKEFGLGASGCINLSECSFPPRMERKLQEKFPDRVLIIEKVGTDDMYGIEESYCLKDMGPNWPDEMIEGLATEEHLNRPLVTRYELLDFED
jgi:hypothetical protein